MFFYLLMILNTYGSIRIDRFVEPYLPLYERKLTDYFSNVTAESSFKNEMILNNKIKLYGAANKQLNFYNLYSYSPINLTCYRLLCNQLSL